MTDIKQAEKLATEAVAAEKQLTKMEQEFALANPAFAEFLKKQQETNQQIAQMWAKVKDALVAAGYTDVLENELFRISISPVFAFEVEDVDKLPKDYTETVKIAKKEKVKKHFELYGEMPDGAANKSYYRLNKKVK